MISVTCMCSLPSVTNDMSDEDRDAISVGRVQPRRQGPSASLCGRGRSGLQRDRTGPCAARARASIWPDQTRNPGCRAVTFGPRAVRARRARTAPRRPRSHWLRAPYARLPTGVAGPPRHALSHAGLKSDQAADRPARRRVCALRGMRPSAWSWPMRHGRMWTMRSRMVCAVARSAKSVMCHVWLRCVGVPPLICLLPSHLSQKTARIKWMIGAHDT